jgi:hypothetical protein
MSGFYLVPTVCCLLLPSLVFLCHPRESITWGLFFRLVEIQESAGYLWSAIFALLCATSWLCLSSWTLWSCLLVSSLYCQYSFYIVSI